MMLIIHHNHYDMDKHKSKMSNPAGSRGEERTVRGRDQVLKEEQEPARQGRAAGIPGHSR